MSFTVAIDGPAAAGKGTIARALADHFGFAYLDTGLLYRAVGRKVLDADQPLTDTVFALKMAQGLHESDLLRDDLRNMETATAASAVAAMGDVRKALVSFQKSFAKRDGGAVLDGRDIGTVICPDADVKLFVTASEDVRAERRYKELSAKGDDTSFDAVLSALKARDAQDAKRDVAPMVQADDAVLIDTSNMSIADALAAAVDVVNKTYKSA
ncbi:cytidylate kinase [Amylibacter kogurei]|uniref:Cytidylate kinase n=1 Tax=Paramylibacter kogurei TaxID=1889778 RepID=A0A2G5K364_9RHOB|nr:(d)CMP kinase [Amylibacter kogurei]PIB23978.1 cytidylate kinase [Amylibacter kogurei]